MTRAEAPLSNSVEYLEDFRQLPSRTGKDVADLEKYARLPRAETYDYIRSFIEGCRKSREVRALFITAEWGEGKTSIYEGFLTKHEIKRSDVIILIRTGNLITKVKEAGEEFSDTTSIGVRFLACLLYALKDVIESDFADIPPFSRIKLRSKRYGESTNSFVRESLECIYSNLDPDSRVFVFIDEFEDLLDEGSEVQSFIIGGLLNVIDGSPRYLNQEPYAGRLHFLIAATPAAYNKLMASSYAMIGRLWGQRVLKVDLEKLDRRNAYDYILGILRYCWAGELPRIPFEEPGMFNAIYLATLGNPRTMINIIEMLLTHPRIRRKDDKIRVISPNDFISILSGREVQIYGGRVTIINKNELGRLYARIEQKCKEEGIDENSCIDFLNLLISSPTPTGEEYIKGKLAINEEVYYRYLAIIRESFNELWGIDPFMLFRVVTNIKDESLVELIEFPSGNLGEIIKTFEFYEFSSDKRSFKARLFVPYESLSRMEFESGSVYRNFIDFISGNVPKLHDEGEIRRLIDLEFHNKVEKSSEKYIMLSPMALNIFYPSPSMFFLDFIEDLDKRFKVGIDVMRNLASYEDYFRRGILQLLKDGCAGRNIRIEEKLERVNVKPVQIFEIHLREAIEEFKVRTYILPVLRVTEAEISERLRQIVDDMRDAGIPLLLIFSWNPLPTEVKAILETHFLQKERSNRKVFYYIGFPLTTLQCHQVVGYALALSKQYNIKRERWITRASRILDELKFVNEVREFVSRGVKGGYTIKQLRLSKLKPKEVPAIVRAILLTDGNAKTRYEQLKELYKVFRIYGKDFPVCPKDIESDKEFESYLNELLDNGLVEQSRGIILIKLSSIEERILAILREYESKIDKRRLNNLFILPSDKLGKDTVDAYLGVLLEKELISYDEKTETISLNDLKDLHEIFVEKRKRLDELKKLYLNNSFGYLASIKARDINCIIVKECISYVEELIKRMGPLWGLPDHEQVWRRNFILFKRLMEQIESIHAIVTEFSKNFDLRIRREVETSYVKRRLKEIEDEIKEIVGRSIIIAEKTEIECIENDMRKLENKGYSRDEIKKKAEGLIRRIYEFNNLYREFRNCPVFDVKIVELAKLYSRLRNLIQRCEECIKNIEEEETRIAELRGSINSHELYRMTLSDDKTSFSAAILKWLRENLKSCVRI